MPDVCVVLTPGAEEIEFVTVADILVRAECQVTVASAETGIVAGSRGIPLAGHRPLDEVLDQDFDCVYLPGGVGSAEYCRDDARIQGLISRQLAASRWLAIICACPISLIPGAHARGRQLTSYPSFRAQLEAAGADWQDSQVVVDGHLVTSQSPGTAMGLGLTLAALLVSPTTADAVAAGMLTDRTSWSVQGVP